MEDSGNNGKYNKWHLIINISPSIPLNDNVLERFWIRKNVSYDFLIFYFYFFVARYLCMSDEKSKFDCKSKQCIFCWVKPWRIWVYILTSSQQQNQQKLKFCISRGSNYCKFWKVRKTKIYYWRTSWSKYGSSINTVYWW